MLSSDRFSSPGLSTPLTPTTNASFCIVTHVPEHQRAAASSIICLPRDFCSDTPHFKRAGRRLQLRRGHGADSYVLLSELLFEHAMCTERCIWLCFTVASPVHVHMSLRKLTHAARMHNRLNFRSSITRVRLLLVSNYWRCQSPSVGSDFYFISRSGTSGCKRRLEVILSHDLNRARRSDCDLSFSDLCSMDADAVLRNKGVRLGIRCQAEGASGAHVVFHQK